MEELGSKEPNLIWSRGHWTDLVAHQTVLWSTGLGLCHLAE
jgi:hypothetical protein